MNTKFKHLLNTTFSFLKEKKILLAVSGGVDSMVLLDLVAKSGLYFAVAHCNFQLRGDESDSETAFLENHCKVNNYKLFTRFFDTVLYSKEHKVSIQIAARELRYSWFNLLLEQENFDYVLTAHHLNDQLETFLINLSRGTGLEGLKGIPNVNNKTVRPLLNFSRAEIESYATAANLDWKEDSSNKSNKYLRNALRLDVIPELEKINPNFLSQFQLSLEHLKSASNMVKEAADMVFDKVVKIENETWHISISHLNKQNNPNDYLFQWLSPFGFTAWADVYGLLTSQSGKQVHSSTHTLLKNRTELLLFKKNSTKDSEIEIPNKDFSLLEPIKITFCNTGYTDVQSNTCIFVDESLLKFPLKLRKWQQGDYFYPFGMKGKKKLSKYFKDEKLSVLDKENTWLLCSNNEIVWVVNYRQDRRFVNEIKEKNTLKITL